MAIKKFNNANENIVSNNITQEEQVQENILRPKFFKDYIGQKTVKENLYISIQASKKRGCPLDHILFYGPPGLGKTTLSQIIANEMNVDIKITSGPALEKPADIIAILSNLKENDILFIDEIHRLKTNTEEILYTAMEDFAVDIMIGQGPSARSVRVHLPKFTIIGATTLASSLTSPLRSRFGNIFKLDFYTIDEITQIILNNAVKLNFKLDKESGYEIARRSRFTPRIANRLLKRVRDFAEVKYTNKKVDLQIVKEALDMLNIDEIGLDNNDRLILKTIVEKFNGGPVGLNNLASTLGEDLSTIENIYEPYLLQIGFLKRTPKGRMITSEGMRHIGMYTNKIKQERIF